MTKTTGMSHDQVFTVECRSEVFAETVVGEGSSRRAAEQMAAELALSMLDKS